MNKGFMSGSPGIWGFSGTGRADRITDRDATILYVSSGHANASNSNEGTDPEYPLAAISSAVASSRLEDGSTIYVAPGTYAESVGVTALMPDYVNLIATGPKGSVFWGPADAGATLTLAANGWLVQGFNLQCPDTTDGNAAIEVTGDYNEIVDCTIYGAADEVIGIDLNACSFCRVSGCLFTTIQTALGTARAITTTAPPDNCLIESNLVTECDNGFVGDFVSCLFRGNIFHGAGTLVMTLALDTDETGATGGNNVVTDNFLGLDYTTAAYGSGVGDSWLGNLTDPAGETTPGATVFDTGVTIAVPVV